MRSAKLRAAKKIATAKEIVASVQRDLEPGPHDAALSSALGGLIDVERILKPKASASERRET